MKHKGELQLQFFDREAKHVLTDNPRFDRARFLAACGVQS